MIYALAVLITMFDVVAAAVLIGFGVRKVITRFHPPPK